MVSQDNLCWVNMGSGDKHHHHHYHLNFHVHLPHLHTLHHHHHHNEEFRDIPRGCMAIWVGQGEEQQRFVIPVMYINHPLFMELLKEAEEEYGFDQKGAINIPCHIEEFRNVQDLIDKENYAVNHHHHHPHLPPHVWCFRV